jgi:3-methylfumaryl-CoA hydratase
MSDLADSVRAWRPGRAEMTRRVEPWPAEAFAGLIGAPPPPLRRGDPLPPMWHWFTLLEHPAQSELGEDGCPVSSPFRPPVPARGRMFAGGRLRQVLPIPVGAQLSRRSSVAAVRVTAGRSGELAFITIRHELAADGVLAGIEEQDIVYRLAPADSPGGGPPGPPGDGTPPALDGKWRQELAIDPVLLFRFSALTYNGHRIHYDRPYATQVEGYPDLVVHGPLLALLALELARVHAPDRLVHAFEYRLVRPAFAPAAIVSLGRPHGDAAAVVAGTKDAAASLTGEITYGR